MGEILRAVRGTWQADRATLYSFQWRRCDADATTCADVAGAIDRVYPVRPGDEGARLVVAVTATPSVGDTSTASAPSVTAASAPTRIVRPAPEDAPLVTVRPTVTGTTEPGSVLTAVSGTWEGKDPIRFAYRWRRCSAEGGACQDLRRATRTYRVTAQDAGSTLRVLVTAGNSIGRSTALSDPTAVVAASPPRPGAPRNTSPPVISGAAEQGRTLTASSGTWSGTPPLGFAFEWRRCGRDGDDCSRIRRVTGQTYTLGRADVGHTIRVRVTARNPVGAASILSDRTGVVVGVSAPVNTSAPTISGTARVGSILTASPGAWRGAAPIRLGYRWMRCDAGGGSCKAIRKATARARTLTSADVGHTLRVRITATNAGGSSSVLSNASAVVASQGTAPANTRAPVLSGTARQGERLSLSSGSWTGTQPISYSYRWNRCDAALNGCTSIAGATGNTYVLTRPDAGKRVFGVVTARNDAGSSSASSNATAVVIGAPVSRTLPAIAGAPMEGRTLTATTGDWSGISPISYGYQWTRCNAKGEFGSCVPIVVTSRPTYALRAVDIGHRIFVQVKAQNRFGASYVNSPLTDVVAAAPVGTVTIRMVRTVVVYGRPVTLMGRAVGAPGGVPVTIVERRVSARARVHDGVAATSSAGTWVYVARPTARTTYRAQIRGKSSVAVTVLVRPRLQLRKAGPGKVSVRAFAARSFAHRIAFLQRWNPKRHRWVNVRRFRLQKAGSGLRGTVVSAATRVQTPRRALVRIVLPSRQAGIGYVTGISNRVRT